MAEACASVVAVLASDDDAEAGRITCREVGDHLIHRAAGQDEGCAWTLYWARSSLGAD